MKITDLSHQITESMTVFPGSQCPKLFRKNNIKDNGYNETLITFSSHVGTHIDAPAHMLQNGKTLDQFSTDKYVGSAVVVDCKNIGNFIEITHLEKYREKISNAEFVLLNTGWSEYWKEDRYFGKFPTLSEEAAKWLVKFDLKGIGVDAISVDTMESETFSIHLILMEKEVIIIENLKNLNEIQEKEVLFSCLPIKFERADGSTVRAVAIEN